MDGIEAFSGTIPDLSSLSIPAPMHNPAHIARNYCEKNRARTGRKLRPVTSDASAKLTLLLCQSRGGAAAAVDQVLPLVYAELRRLAGKYLQSKGHRHTLQPTALVHEAYLRLAQRSEVNWQDKAHFFSIAASVMRNILVDHARSTFALKRGGDRPRAQFKDSVNYSDEKASDLIALEDALNALAAIDSRKARVLELRYFGGLSLEETAEAMKLSVATVRRETRHAEAWLRRELKRS